MPRCRARARARRPRSTAPTASRSKQVVGDLLLATALTIAVAESCTGGLLASRLTDVPGSSAYFDRGVVCYSNAAKMEWLGVPEALIAEHGAVSEPVAHGDGRRRSRASAGTTSVSASPASPGPAAARPRSRWARWRLRSSRPARPACARSGSSARREMVKFQATQAAMNMLRLMLSEPPRHFLEPRGMRRRAIEQPSVPYLRDRRVFVMHWSENGLYT